MQKKKFSLSETSKNDGIFICKQQLNINAIKLLYIAKGKIVHHFEL
jgi:hypothetical protein